MALDDGIEFEQLKKLRIVCEKIYELVRKRKYVEVNIRIDGGDIIMWTETSKHKP